MTYKINDTPVIENNGDAKFTQLTVTGGSILLPDANPSRNTTGYKISSQTNIDPSGRGVHAKVTIDATSPSNYAIVGSSRSYGYSVGGLKEHSVRRSGSSFESTSWNQQYNYTYRYGITDQPLSEISNAARTPIADFPTSPSGSRFLTESGIRHISRFPFSNESDTYLFNSLTNSVSHSTSARSITDGYSIGGISVQLFPETLPALSGGATIPTGPISASRPPRETGGIVRNFNSNSFMEKFPFASETKTNTISNPLLINYGSMGFQSETNGFKFGGLSGVQWSYGWAFTNCNSDMSTFPFATDSVSSTGIIAPTSSAYGGNVNSSQHGYIYGGLFRALWPDSFVDYEVHKTVLKFPYATATYTVVMPNTYPGNTLLGCMMPAHASTTHGYVLSGGGRPASPGNIGSRGAFFESGEMRKFSFSSDASSVSIGNLTENILEKYAYYSSDSNGYVDRRLFPQVNYLGPPSPFTPPTNFPSFSPSNIKQRLKFPFATDVVAQETGGYLIRGEGGAVGIEGG